ncbi:GntR family transcriptional regulator [Schumannella sp. 10F1B-5-1]|uniref:GntR family transcriptional regulator n=1 Tax=Schumannella sp. 10F1B-5-1 TaxID=2590780 RepID=UPI0015E86C3A|nr:GntR family transcriptional regulator [Schumannella sp. 10F1B-5-1]
MPVPSEATTSSAERHLLRDVVLERLRDAIMDGTLQPGESLNDKELQAWLGVSRTPIRDAINELTRRGLIEMEPNRYTRVASPTQADALDAMHTLGTIYGGAVRLGALHLSDEDAALIQKQIAEMIAAMGAQDIETLRSLVFPTFDLFVRRSQSPLLIKLAADTVDGLAFRVRVERVLELVDVEQVAADFRALGEAAVARDAIAAELATERIFQLPETA